MYKNPDKQREADRERQRRYRTKRDKRGVTKGVTSRSIKGVTNARRDKKALPELGVTEGVTIIKAENHIDASDINIVKTLHQAITTQGVTADVQDELTLKPNEVFTACEKRLNKRGNDIKCFEDLPPDVQRTIDRMSVVNGKIDQTIKANRTAIAINYQHLFPDRYYSAGVA